MPLGYPFRWSLWQGPRQNGLSERRSTHQSSFLIPAGRALQPHKVRPAISLRLTSDNNPHRSRPSHRVGTGRALSQHSA